MKALRVGLVLTIAWLCIACEPVPTAAYPDSQQAFFALNKQCRARFQAGQNEIQRSLAFNQCNDARKVFAGGNSIYEWVGSLDRISTDQGADVASVTIRANLDSFESTFGTLGNRLSDSGHNTMITPDDPLFSALAQMKEGDAVVFSGDFLQHPEAERGIWETSITERGSIEEPEFAVRFTSIRPYRADNGNAATSEPAAANPDVAMAEIPTNSVPVADMTTQPSNPAPEAVLVDERKPVPHYDSYLPHCFGEAEASQPEGEFGSRDEQLLAIAMCQCKFDALPVGSMTKDEFFSAGVECLAEWKQDSAAFTQKYISHFELLTAD